MDAFPGGAEKLIVNVVSEAPTMVMDEGAVGKVVTYNILLALDVPIEFVAVIVNG